MVRAVHVVPDLGTLAASTWPVADGLELALLVAALVVLVDGDTGYLDGDLDELADTLLRRFRPRARA